MSETRRIHCEVSETCVHLLLEVVPSELPYILECYPHHFYSFRGLKKSDAD